MRGEPSEAGSRRPLAPGTRNRAGDPSVHSATMEEAQKSGDRGSPAKIAIAIVAVAALFVLAWQAGEYVPDLAKWVDGLGAWGPFAFVLVYAVAVVAFVPGAVLTLAGGAIFDLLWGTIYVFIAAVIGSSGAFLVARYVAR